MVVKYLILFAVMKLLRLMTMMGFVMRAVMEIVTVLMVAVVPRAFICISACVIKHCVPKRQGRRKMSNLNDVFAPVSDVHIHTCTV